MINCCLYTSILLYFVIHRTLLENNEKTFYSLKDATAQNCYACRENFYGRLHLIRQKERQEERQEERKEDDWPQSGSNMCATNGGATAQSLDNRGYRACSSLLDEFTKANDSWMGRTKRRERKD
ncbi:hypothetical protein LSAT2_016325 [Lamellibrachia satsuma]|nr:hypothetical protein LSAT2_016325 [Lamellibrachia satsuma]